MKNTNLAISAAALALAGSVAVLAAQGDHARHSPDADGDGMVTLAENSAHGHAVFARIDSNQDGVLDAADREAQMDERFAAMDADGSGEISEAELEADAARRQAARAERRAQRRSEWFASADADGSGGLSRSELESGREAMREKFRSRREKTERGEMQMRRGRGHGPAMLLHMADTDKDAAVTRAEFDVAMQTRFARMDGDGDGAITAEERSLAREAMRARHGERGIEQPAQSEGQ